MLKAELEAENNYLKRRAKEKDALIQEALKEVLDTTCSEGRQKVIEFCEIAEIEVPTIKMVIEVPYGTNEITEIQDGDYDTIDFEVLDYDFQED